MIPRARRVPEQEERVFSILTFSRIQKRNLVAFGLEARQWLKDQIKPGVIASRIAKVYIEFFRDMGRGESYFMDLVMVWV